MSSSRSGYADGPVCGAKKMGRLHCLGCTLRQPSVDAHRDASRFDPSGRVTARRALLGGHRYERP